MGFLQIWLQRPGLSDLQVGVSWAPAGKYSFAVCNLSSVRDPHWVQAALKRTMWWGQVIEGVVFKVIDFKLHKVQTEQTDD